MSKEQEEKRFEQTSEQMRVVFTPQCTDCALNVSRDECKQFEFKPRRYAKNKEECPYKV